MNAKLDTLFTPGLVAAQQPTWPGGPDGPQVKAAVAELKALPPLSLLVNVMISKLESR